MRRTLPGGRATATDAEMGKTNRQHQGCRVQPGRPRTTNKGAGSAPGYLGVVADSTMGSLEAGGAPTQRKIGHWNGGAAPSIHF